MSNLSDAKNDPTYALQCPRQKKFLSCSLCKRRRGPLESNIDENVNIPLFRMRNVKDEDIKNQWCDWIQEYYPEVNISPNLYVGGEHFSPMSIKGGNNMRWKLERGAVPSIYVHPLIYAKKLPVQDDNLETAAKRKAPEQSNIAPKTNKIRRQIISDNGAEIRVDISQAAPSNSSNLNVSGCSTLDMSLGAVNYRTTSSAPVSNNLTRQVILDTIKEHYNILESIDRNIVFDETPIRNNFKKERVGIENSINSWLNESRNMNDLAPTDIQSLFEKLKVNYGLQLRYLSMLSTKNELIEHDYEMAEDCAVDIVGYIAALAMTYLELG
ncbi:uncharacterized protein LOC132196179 [Neocloeon triangulifer]|uniref:uncharacterized protein LOC132196179 n=1 Tax=Neocloeon triangulifer TaxID=2078957 RepID=UPI00286F4665|nr:uncharacterized protein LOC132196179 [Neocloeon triangulifer]